MLNFAPVIYRILKAHDVSGEPRDSHGRWTIVRMDYSNGRASHIMYGAAHEGKVYHRDPYGRLGVRAHDERYWSEVPQKDIDAVLPHAGKRTTWGLYANDLKAVMNPKWQADAKKQHAKYLIDKAKADRAAALKEKKAANPKKYGYGLLNVKDINVGDMLQDLWFDDDYIYVVTSIDGNTIYARPKSEPDWTGAEFPLDTAKKVN